jgi:integrase
MEVSAMASRNSIDTPTKRNKLPPRREPYWHKIITGRHIGFRRTETGGTWIARLTQDRRSVYEALGGEGVLTYDQAVEKAMEWFSHAAGLENHRYTVWDAVIDYRDHLKVNNSETASNDAHDRLNNHLSDKFRKTPIADLKTAQIKRWHQGLVRISDDAEDMRRSKDGANKLLSKLKAALNLAFNSGLAASDQEWRRVKPFRDVEGSRTLFLTDPQVKVLLDNADGAFKALLHAAVYTGARYGELTALRAQDLDLEQGTLQLDGKTGERNCYLSDAALAWFKAQAKSKLPKAILLPRDDGEPWGKSHQHRHMQMTVQAAKLPRETVFYSLRHYHISKALLAGVPVQVVAENCGTSVRMIEKHYGKFLPQDRRNFFNQVKLG